MTNFTVNDQTHTLYMSEAEVLAVFPKACINWSN